MKVGILGGGQLARMLSEAGQALGHEVHVLGQAGDPAAGHCTRFIEGAISDLQTLTSFVQEVDVITIENEFVDTDLISQALQKSNRRVLCYPQLPSIRVAQDKLNQKELFNRCHLPTAKHRTLAGEDFQKEILDLQEDFPAGFVLKWSKFGYDGKGNFVFRSPDRLLEATGFCQQAKDKGVRVYAEELISFESELAMVFVRTRGGFIENYPLVFSEQKDNICKWVEGPATRMGAPVTLQTEAIGMGRAIGDTLQMTGTFALEFFYSKNRGIMINEMAPRVHNSGHFTLNAAETSQFANHMKAITGERLGSTATAPFFGMLNLIGPGSGPSAPDSEGQLQKSSGKFFPYWYGKKEVRIGRKMGHINVVASSLTELQGMKFQLMEQEAQIWKNVIGPSRG